MEKLAKGTKVRVTVTNPTDKHMNGAIGVVTQDDTAKGGFIKVRLPGQTVLWRFFRHEVEVVL